MADGIASLGPDVTCKYFCVDLKKNMFFIYCQETLIVEERLLSRDSCC